MKDEGEELRKRFDALKRDKGISRAAFAKMNGIKGGDAMIYQHINGLKPISLEAGMAYAKGFDCKLEDISERLKGEVQAISDDLSQNVNLGLKLLPRPPRLSHHQRHSSRQLA
jgi:hypothetical protein